MRPLQEHVLIAGYGPLNVEWFFFILRLIWSLTKTVEEGMLPFTQVILCCCFALRENNEQSPLTALLCVCNCCQQVGISQDFPYKGQYSIVVPVRSLFIDSKTPYRPGQVLRVPGGWVSQFPRQSAHEGGKVVSPTRRPPLPQKIFLVLSSVVHWQY